MKAHHDNQGDIKIEFNSQTEAILSPDGTQKLLPCDCCGELRWRDLNVVSGWCKTCFDFYTTAQKTKSDNEYWDSVNGLFRRLLIVNQVAGPEAYTWENGEAYHHLKLITQHSKDEGIAIQKMRDLRLF